VKQVPVIYRRDRESSEWLVSVVADDRLHTHGRTIRSARKAILDVIELWHQVPANDVELEETFDLADVAPDVEAALEARAAAARAQEAAAARSIAAARQLANAGISRRDSAEILGYTFQRVQQLVAGADVVSHSKRLEQRRTLEG
jgi:predicted RNase H-like HicB family nuclease